MPTRQRPRSAMSQRLQQSAAEGGRQLLKDWIGLTFGSDHVRVLGPLTFTHLNWVFVASAATVGVVAPQTLPQLAIAVFAWLAISLIRANYVQRRRRRTLASIFETVAPRAKLPVGTVNSPASPANHIQRLRWGAGQNPQRFKVTLGSSAPAANAPLLRSEVEADIENIPHALQKRGGEWHFEWDNRTVTATAVAADDPTISRKAYLRRIAAVVREIFSITRANAAGWNVQVDDWGSAETADGGTADYPAKIVIRCAERDLTDHSMRDKVERHFERAITTPREWIYEWDGDTSTVTATGVAADSMAAMRKRNERRIGDDMRALVSRTGKDPIVVTVTEWISDDLDLPRTLHANFGTLSLDDSRARTKVEDGFDAAVQNRWPLARALFIWHHSAVTELDITLVADSDPLALQRTAETRLRSVTDSKFGSAKNPVTTEILEWQDSLSPSGAMLPQIARVMFGTVDVTKPDTRDAFQDHWDSIDNNNDWHYEWNIPAGFVEMNAVPKLPESLAFPEIGTPEHDFYVEMFREGKIVIGPQKGGGYFIWNLNKVAHGLIGGRTGAGKSVLLDIILYLILNNKDVADVVVCDPKMTDFTWTPEFPSVLRFAAGVVEISEAIGWVKAEMEKRQKLLNRRGVRNLGELRRHYLAHPTDETEDGPAPKRLFLFFDELANYSGPSNNEDLEELKKVARGDLENMGQLARAMEINMIVAAQKPEAKFVSTQLKEMMEFRVCVGPVNQYTSEQILESNHGTRFPEGTPKGRAWATTSELGFQVVQVPYLPSATGPAPWDPSLTIEGSRDRLRRGLTAEGWHQIFQPNKDGGQDPRWVRVEDDDPDSDTTPADGRADDGDENPGDHTGGDNVIQLDLTKALDAIATE